MLRSRIALVTALTALTSLAAASACRSQPATSGATTVTYAEIQRTPPPPGIAQPASFAGADTAGPAVQVPPLVVSPIAVPSTVVTPVGVDAGAPQPRQDGSVSVDAEQPTVNSITSQRDPSFPETTFPSSSTTSTSNSFPETSFGPPTNTETAPGDRFPETSFGSSHVPENSHGFPETTFP